MIEHHMTLQAPGMEPLLLLFEATKLNCLWLLGYLQMTGFVGLWRGLLGPFWLFPHWLTVRQQLHKNSPENSALCSTLPSG